MIKKTLCFSNRAYLSCRNHQLIIKVDDPVSGTTVEHARPIEDIGVLIIESEQVSLTSYLISRLLENKVAIIICDSKHMPCGMTLSLVGNTEQSERYSAQINASLPLKKQLWQQTVSMKIRNQATVLKSVRSIEVGNMFAWSNQVRSGDADNLEGRAAVYYWRRLFGEESEFIRRRDAGDVNSLLNYGYAILRAVIARSIVSSGLIPTLGIHHSNKYNAYCLADDIMEPYRPYVDLLVVNIVENAGLKAELTKETKMQLLTIPTIDVSMGRLTRPLMVAASMTTASLAKCYLGESRKILYPEIEI